MRILEKPLAKPLVDQSGLLIQDVREGEVRAGEGEDARCIQSLSVRTSRAARDGP